ncbi:LacI family DNA-binding transcriptional regulator [Chelativorans sp. AA-79]|uniref:LacI family DNA-binding transcriptional regulator n=1 Tax=Chelativorans sp. AA-79 TaxID=3028735 RepID=UPI0023F71E4D|nr:LacI family DNA-binding transcriptional regulator [Chelativorans sp. AA-79]WEX10118.1 LacI family DNA-binding transcriptional regulator [Chelativorans sp. AA-79]
MTIATRRPNQAEIAARLGVSVSTVSRALANEAGVSEALRRDVYKIARALGYRSKHAGAMGVERRAVALVPLGGATSGMSGFYVGIVDGMRAAAEETGLELDMRLINESQVSLDLIERHITQSEASGLLLAGIDAWDGLVDWCAERAFPVVLVNGTDPLMRLNSVSPANFYGAYRAAQRLLDAGHRRILHYTHLARPTILERRRGFESAMAAVSGAESVIISTSERTIPQLLEDLLSNRHQVTAVFSWNDLAAVEIIEGLHGGSGILPETFSIVGFDDLPLAGMTSPRLSTMRVDREAIGRGAIRLLVTQMEGEAAVQQLEIGVTLVEGQTVRQLKR